MAYNPVPTVATGDPWSAANANTYWRDNFAAGVPDIFTAAGQMVYATGADAATPLSIGTAYARLRVNAGATAPEWGGPLLRTASAASSATPTPNADTTDLYILTALAEAATFGAPSGTPLQGQLLEIRIKDNGTARALAWNAAYRAGAGIALPTTTVISKLLYLLFQYNATDSKWDLLAKGQES